jgi:hypothetical protein
MAWGGSEYSALGAIVGAVVTAVGAGFVYWQISAASSTLYSGNSYTVQKDIIEAGDRVREAQDQITYQDSDHPKNAALVANLLLATRRREVRDVRALSRDQDLALRQASMGEAGWPVVVLRTTASANAS